MSTYSAEITNGKLIITSTTDPKEDLWQLTRHKHLFPKDSNVLQTDNGSLEYDLSDPATRKAAFLFVTQMKGQISYDGKSDGANALLAKMSTLNPDVAANVSASSSATSAHSKTSPAYNREVVNNASAVQEKTDSVKEETDSTKFHFFGGAKKH